MPFVNVKMLAGRTHDQKRALAKAITNFRDRYGFDLRKAKAFATISRAVRVSYRGYVRP